MSLGHHLGNLKPKTTAHVSAWAAVMGLVFSLPAAIMALRQASSADHSAEVARNAAFTAQATLSELRGQTRIAAMKLQVANAELDQMRALVDADRSTAASAQRFAAASEEGARFAGDSAEAAHSQASSARDLADSARSSLLEEHAARDDTRRPRLVYQSCEPDDWSPDHLTGTVHFRNGGVLEPSNIRAWSSFQIMPATFNTPVAPACEVGDWHPLGPIGEGGVHVARREALSASEASRLYANKATMTAYGAVCYRDQNGKNHRVDWCAYRDSDNNWRNCAGVPPSD